MKKAKSMDLLFGRRLCFEVFRAAPALEHIEPVNLGKKIQQKANTVEILKSPFFQQKRQISRPSITE